MTIQDPLLNYYERITCSAQWKHFNRALAAELSVGLPPEENRQLFARIGARVVEGLPVARCNTLEELQTAFNAQWEAIDWGFCTLQETGEHLSITHVCSPLAMAFGPDEVDWSSGFFEGAYQTWFAAQGIPPELRVRLDAPSEGNAASKVVLTLARSAS